MDDRFKDPNVFKRPETQLYQRKEDVPWNSTMTLEDYFIKAFEMGMQERASVQTMKMFSPDAFARAKLKFEKGGNQNGNEEKDDKKENEEIKEVND